MIKQVKTEEPEKQFNSFHKDEAEIQLPIEWEIDKQDTKKRILHLSPIIISLLTFIWLPLFIDEMGWAKGLALGLSSAIGLILIIVLYLIYFFHNYKVKISEQGIYVSENKKQKFYAWDTLESFTDLSKNQSIISSSLSNVNLGSDLQNYYKKVGGIFRIYLKHYNKLQIPKFNSFILVTKPENNIQVKNILSKFLVLQKNLYSKQYKLLFHLAPFLGVGLVALLILIGFLYVRYIK